MTNAVFEYYQANRERFLEGLKAFLRIPSISTLPEHKPDIQRAVEFVGGELREMGMKNVEIITGTGNQNPLIYAEWLEAPGKPTLLIYGHYDVQPPDPLEEWLTPPFEPTVRNDNIYARGAVDDKGQAYLLLKAVEGFLKTEGKLPINVKFLIEGEEEMGGEHIEAYVAAHADRLKADAALVCDTEMFAPELPTITTGLRGLIYTELEARGPAHDLHSGMFGGAAPNPIQQSGARQFFTKCEVECVAGRGRAHAGNRHAHRGQKRGVIPPVQKCIDDARKVIDGRMRREWIGEIEPGGDAEAS